MDYQVVGINSVKVEGCLIDERHLIGFVRHLGTEAFMELLSESPISTEEFMDEYNEYLEDLKEKSSD